MSVTGSHKFKWHAQLWHMSILKDILGSWQVVKLGQTDLLEVENMPAQQFNYQEVCQLPLVCLWHCIDAQGSKCMFEISFAFEFE